MEKSKFQKDFCGANRTERCINICGNIKDKLVSFAGTGYTSLTDFASDFFKANNYTDIRFYSPALGYSDHGFDESSEVQGNQRRKTLIGALAEKINATSKVQTPVAWIIEDASYLCQSNTHPGNEEFFAWLMIKKSIESCPRNHRFIFFYENKSDINRFMSPFKTLYIGKPDHTQRKQFIAEYFPYLENSEMEFVADRTDGIELSKMEDIFLNALSVNEKPGKNLLKKAIDDYFYGYSENPWTKIDAEKLAELEKYLKANVLGQDEAIEEVVRIIKTACSGASSVLYGNKRPIGISFFPGPTGVGKTELAKQLSKFVFGDEDSVVRIDANEYGQEVNCERLVGSPPGYVGYEAGGQLTNAVKEKPFCFLLVEEIDKASPKFWDYFMTILQDGRLTSGQGETVMFNYCYIIFTTNLGAEKAAECDNDKECREIFKEETEKFFKDHNRREIFGRLKPFIIPFNMIDEKTAKEIIKMKLKKVSKTSFEENGICLVFSDSVSASLATHCGFCSEYGGRDVDNKLKDTLQDIITEIYTKHKKPGVVITMNSVDYDSDGKAIFQYSVEYHEEPTEAVVDYPPINPSSIANDSNSVIAVNPQRRIRRTAVVN